MRDDHHKDSHALLDRAALRRVYKPAGDGAVRKAAFPTMGQMLADQIAGDDAVATDQLIEQHKNDSY
ncbi:MAG: hypothetical protein SFV19_06855 [Rhodospirillaceae bacterium]|nr:hypothetical protein [Rhodospirillaceae bacterium]